MPEFTQPLPEIVKAANSEQLTVDVGALVNRDIDVRRAEQIGPQKLPPKKPQNSFFLYEGLQGLS